MGKKHKIIGLKRRRRRRKIKRVIEVSKIESLETQKKERRRKTTLFKSTGFCEMFNGFPLIKLYTLYSLVGISRLGLTNGFRFKLQKFELFGQDLFYQQLTPS